MTTAILIKAFGAFFAIMNPFVNLPIFLAMTDGMSTGDQRKLAFKIVFYSTIMCAAILVAGQAIIDFFGVSIADFRIAGGAVLASIAWSMLNGGGSKTHHGSVSEKAEIDDLSSLAFYPLTFPMIVGPGTIATIIIFASNAKHTYDLLAIGGVLLAILAILFVVLFFASMIGKHMSQTLRSIMTRLMGMILIAISVEMILGGLKSALPGLAG